MAKMCWRCQEYHDDGMRECPYCGAAFVSDDASYMRDGRTISTEDEDAYLRSGPPRYRRDRRIALSALVVIVCAIAVYAAVDYSGVLEPDISYDYSLVSLYPEGDGTALVYDVLIMDDKLSSIDWSGTSFWLVSDGIRYEPFSEAMTDMGLLYSGRLSFVIPSDDTVEGCEMKASHRDGYSFSRDDSLLRG